ncbi:MAG: nucleotide sugar dehydrogenase, partial [Acidobacteria bacterium]|nr:nucleotide sugar dehydrogenase [Acidobacteriota bacterium]
MHLGVHGTGHLGTLVSACVADFGLPVTCFDQDEQRTLRLAEGSVAYHEKNLTDMVRRNVRAGRLTYSTDLASFSRRADVIFLAEDTHRYIEEVALQIAAGANPRSTLVVVTPVPVGTAARIESRIKAAGLEMTVVSHPLFLTDGCAVEDFNWPDRILLGTTSSEAVFAMKEIYRPLLMRGVPVIVTSTQTAELVREASTAFVATKIAFINEVATLCERVEADAVELAMALGLDKRIAPRCLQPGAGFGGPFVESEMEALAQLAYGNGVPLKVLSAAREVNQGQSDRIADKISLLLETIPDKSVSILGLAFKPHTNSVAASSSIQLAKRLLTAGAHVRAYDPVAMPEAKVELNGDKKLHYCESAYEAAESGDVLVVGTAWPEFRSLDFERIKRSLKRALVVDTKNLLDGVYLRAL